MFSTKMEAYKKLIPDKLLDILCSPDPEMQQIGFAMLKITSHDFATYLPAKRFIFKALIARLKERGRFLRTRSRRGPTGLVTVPHTTKKNYISDAKKKKWENKARIRSQNS